MLACAMGWTITEGYAPHYAPGVMDRVADIRGLERVDCQVSSPVLGIGNWVYVVGVNTGVVRYCRVTDVSEAIDRLRHIRTRRVVEIGFRLVPVLCSVSIDEPPEKCPVIVVSEF